MHNLVHNYRNLYFPIKQFITSQLQELFRDYYRLIRKSFHQFFRDCFYLRFYPATEQGLCYTCQRYRNKSYRIFYHINSESVCEASCHSGPVGWKGKAIMPAIEIFFNWFSLSSTIFLIGGFFVIKLLH